MKQTWNFCLSVEPVSKRFNSNSHKTSFIALPTVVLQYTSSHTLIVSSELDLLAATLVVSYLTVSCSVDIVGL